MSKLLVDRQDAPALAPEVVAGMRRFVEGRRPAPPRPVTVQESRP